MMASQENPTPEFLEGAYGYQHRNTDGGEVETEQLTIQLDKGGEFYYSHYHNRYDAFDGDTTSTKSAAQGRWYLVQPGGKEVLLHGHQTDNKVNYKHSVDEDATAHEATLAFHQVYSVEDLQKMRK